MPLLKGALIEYGSDFLGPLPNVLLFQYNPDRLERTIEVPARPSGAGARETDQAGEIPIEKITFTAKFDASDRLGEGSAVARAFGVGPELAALELMVRPSGEGSLLGMAIDAIGDAIAGSRGSDASQPIPRERYPRLLFIWGPTRVLPVYIHQMRITEVLYDRLLNPIQADVALGLTVIAPEHCSEDHVAHGAYTYSQTAKETLATINLANTAANVAEMITF
ncbi:MAG: hypothetical protein H6711_30930 [Myxococcales bacterium]|nr:hypothetical protein [Myxococcales bacterium]